MNADVDRSKGLDCGPATTVFDSRAARTVTAERVAYAFNAVENRDTPESFCTRRRQPQAAFDEKGEVARLVK